MQGLRAKRLLECVSRTRHQYNPCINPKLTSSLRLSRIEGLQGIRGAEGGSDVEFHDIPNNPSTNNIRSATPGTADRTELPILLRILQETVDLFPLAVLQREVLLERCII